MRRKINTGLSILLITSIFAMTGCSAKDGFAGMLGGTTTPIIQEEAVTDTTEIISEDGEEIKEVADIDAAILRVFKEEGTEADYLALADYYIASGRFVEARDILLDGIAIYESIEIDNKLDELVFSDEMSPAFEKYILGELYEKLLSGNMGSVITYLESDLWSEAMLPEKNAGKMNHYIGRDGKLKLYVSSGFEKGEEQTRLIFVDEGSYVVAEQTSSDCKIIIGNNGIDSLYTDVSNNSERTSAISGMKLDETKIAKMSDVLAEFKKSSGFALVSKIMQNDYSMLSGGYTMWMINSESGDVVKMDGDFSTSDTPGVESEGRVFVFAGNGNSRSLVDIWSSKDNLKFVEMVGSLDEIKDTVLGNGDIATIITEIKESDNLTVKEEPVNQGGGNTQTPSQTPAQTPSQTPSQPSNPTPDPAPSNPATNPAPSNPTPDPAPSNPTPDPAPSNPTPDPAPSQPSTPSDGGDTDSGWTPILG